MAIRPADLKFGVDRPAVMTCTMDRDNVKQWNIESAHYQLFVPPGRKQRVFVDADIETDSPRLMGSEIESHGGRTSPASQRVVLLSP